MRNSDRRFEVRRRLSLNQNFPFQNSSCILLKFYAILIFLYFVFIHNSQTLLREKLGWVGGGGGGGGGGFGVANQFGLWPFYHITSTLRSAFCTRHSKFSVFYIILNLSV